MGRKTKEEARKIAKIHLHPNIEEMTNKEICEKFNVSPGTLNKIKKKHGIKNARAKSKKEMSTERKIEVISNFDTSNMTIAQIQKVLKFNTYTAAWYFCKRKGIEFKKEK